MLPLEEKQIQDREANAFRCRCTQCGTYDIAHRLIAGEKSGSTIADDSRLRLSHAIRKATDAHGRFVEVLDYEAFRLLAEQHPLPDAIEQADILIDSIARRSSYGEATPEENFLTWAARIGLKGFDQLHSMQRELAALVKERGLDSDPRATNVTVEFTLTLEGWKRARELRQHRGRGNQAFVAMWFHSEMDGAFDAGFVPALEETGYQPYRVDRAAHNNKIDDQIVAEIRRSTLVVVDATGARPNAYFEAGFAMGLGIPVIWCCNGSWQGCVLDAAPNSATVPPHRVRGWMEVLPLDTRQHSFVVWSEPADLREKLTAKIRALGFDAAWNRGQ